MNVATRMIVAPSVNVAPRTIVAPRVIVALTVIVSPRAIPAPGGRYYSMDEYYREPEGRALGRLDCFT